MSRYLKIIVLFMLLAPLASLRALADPGYYVVTAYDNEGQRSVDTRYWTVKTPGSPATLWPEIGVGYGVTSRWYTEVLASYIGTLDTAQKISSLNWQNEILLTRGQYPFDLALHASLIRTYGYDAGTTFEYGPVLQTEVGRLQINANVFFDRHWSYESPQEPTEVKYQWQLRYHWRPLLNFGLQGFGELGTFDDVSSRANQSHRAGPAIFGSWRMADGHQLMYQLAYLFGKTYGQRGDMFTMRVQYTF